MLSALVLCRSRPEPLIATLSALVEGVAEGVVADAVVICRHADDDIAMIADATGAELVIIGPDGDPWSAGAAMARREWLFCLEAGDIPLDGWIGATDRFTATGAMEDYPIGRLGRRARDWREWLSDRFARLTRRAQAGDVVHASRLSTDAATAGAVRPRIQRLPAQIMRQTLRVAP